MEQGKKADGAIDTDEFNRQHMAPADYFNWLTRQMGKSELEEITERKRDISHKITLAVRAFPGFTNEKIEQIVKGPVQEETINEWIIEEKKAKLARLSAKPFAIRDRKNYTADKVAYEMDKEEDRQEKATSS